MPVDGLLRVNWEDGKSTLHSRSAVHRMLREAVSDLEAV
jgi:hypothetical protein